MLGNHMRSPSPENTLLPDLAMQPMASEAVDELQEALRNMISPATLEEPASTSKDPAAPGRATRATTSTATSNQPFDLVNTPAKEVQPSERLGLVLL